MPIMTIRTNNLEQEMAAMKAMLERLLSRVQKRRCTLSYKRERLPWRSSWPNPLQKAQKVRRTIGRPSKPKLSTRRYTQRRAVNSNMAGL